jgi:hypothetical protein
MHDLQPKGQSEGFQELDEGDQQRATPFVAPSPYLCSQSIRLQDKHKQIQYYGTKTEGVQSDHSG